MQALESEKDRAARLYRTLETLMRRATAGERPAPLREHLRIAVMMSPLSGAEQAAVLRQFDDAVDASRKVDGE